MSNLLQEERPFALTMFENYLYVLGSTEMKKVHRISGQIVPMADSDIDHPAFIRVFHQQRQPKGI